MKVFCKTVAQFFCMREKCTAFMLILLLVRLALSTLNQILGPAALHSEGFSVFPSSEQMEAELTYRLSILRLHSQK
jgi:hypothetical protein